VVEIDEVSRRRPWWALAWSVVGAALALGLGVSMVEDGPTADEPHPMALLAPAGVVELDALPADHQVLYQAAAADEEAFSAVRCYCGCESFLGHEDLLACFVRADGGWEAHATGCAVCLGEAEEVVELREEGVPIAEIVERIDRRYGGIDLGSLT
jgi:hypothetical protein